MRDFLVIGLAIAALIILGRVIWKSPFLWGMREAFANGSNTAAATAKHMMNSSTECPSGTRMYMYGGKAYCCNGIVNVDAESAQQSCRLWTPTPGSTSELLFCSLGPSSDGIVNCQETLGGRMQADGERYCPSEAPNFVKGPTLPDVSGRCCKSPADAQFQDCQDPTQYHCAVTAEQNIFKAPNSCQFRKLTETNTCPTDYSTVAVPGHNAFQGIFLIGCSDSGTICYTRDIVAKLKQLGYDTSSLTLCPTK